MIIYTEGTIPGRPGIGPIAILKEDTIISRCVERTGRLDHDQELIPRIVDLIEPGAMVVDAGAMIGDHTSAYASKAGLVYAFEPHPENFECLRQNCATLPGCLLFQKALSDVAGPAKLRNCFDFSNMGGGSVDLASGNIEINTITLDSLGISPQLIKMDVEGYEVKALRGAERTIARSRPILVLEVNLHALENAGDSVQALADILAEYRYESRDIMYGSPLKGDCQHPLYDIVCRPLA